VRRRPPPSELFQLKRMGGSTSSAIYIVVVFKIHSRRVLLKQERGWIRQGETVMCVKRKARELLALIPSYLLALPGDQDR